MSKEFAAYSSVEGAFEGRDKNDDPILRHVSCFHLGLSALQAADMELSKREGDIIRILKSPEAIDELADRLAPFAHLMLSNFIRGSRLEVS